MDGKHIPVLFLEGVFFKRFSVLFNLYHRTGSYAQLAPDLCESWSPAARPCHMAHGEGNI